MSLYIQRQHEGEEKGKREKEGLKTGKDATWEENPFINLHVQFRIEFNVVLPPQSTRTVINEKGAFCGKFITGFSLRTSFVSIFN